MKKPSSARELAIDLTARSTCRVRMAAVLSDAHGILSWGWNSSGLDGFGWHAETHAISRANRRRLKGATLTVAGFRNRNGRTVNAKPCASCASAIRVARIGRVEYLDKGRWKALID